MNNITTITEPNPALDLITKAKGPYSTILADPPWQFQNRTGKMAPEHKRGAAERGDTSNLEEYLYLLF